MSETPAAPRAGGHENVFTHKLGPLPTWAWIAIAGGILVIWRIFSNKKTAAAAQQNAAGATTASGSTAANTVPQFVNQTYTTVTAPSAPSTTAGTTTPTNSGTGHGQHSRPTQTFNWLDELSTLGTPPHAPVTTTNPAPAAASSIGSVTGLRSTGAGATNVGLSWNPVSGATQYQVRVTYQSKVVATAMTNGTSFNVTGLAPNRTYGLHVVAINGSDWAPEASITQKTS